MTGYIPGSDCVVIEDNDINDLPGPVRLKHNPSACELEEQWFDQPFNRPSDQVVCSDIPEKYILAFKELIWNQPHDRMVPGYGMTPKELACVSSDGRKGWLVSSHFYWLSRCINQQQNHTCFFVLDPTIKKVALHKLLGGKSAQDVKRLIFVMSVGRQDDGIVFLGTDKMPGDHWSVAIVDISKAILYYCDTLGWPEPEKLCPFIIKYTNVLGLTQTSQLKLKRAHEPNAEQHECTSACTNYPLQTCSDICGVIAVICISVAALDKDFFELMMTPIDKKFNLYLTDPTEYSAYLRHVLIYWIASNNIDITRISLKPNFDPFSSLNKEKNVLKRKLEFSLNGDGHFSPKRSALHKSLICTDNINDFILDAQKNKVTSSIILNEVVSKIGTYLQTNDAFDRNLRIQYEGFIPNPNIARSREDRISTRSYMAELIKLSNDKPIILFKNKGTEMEHLDKDDVVVAIQTPFQKKMMQIYGSKCLCVDLSKSRNEDNLTVMTLLVFVDGSVELPVAWLVSNRIDKYIIDLFFKMLHSNVGNLQTNLFLGDFNWNFHKLWIQNFPKPTTKMFCWWDVQQTFHSYLESHVPDEEIKSQLKDYLNALSYISDPQAFDAYVEALFVVLKPHKRLSELLNTKFFSEYKEKFWASCYRYLPGYKSVPFLRQFSHTLNILGLKKGLNRMDAFVHMLLQLNRFLENKIYILPCEVSLQKAVSDMNLKHQQNLDELDIYESASGDEWYIPASDETEAVSILESGINSCGCPLKCDKCKICVHQYVCTCVDFLMKPGSCKHIHFIHKYRQMNRVLQNSDDSPSSSTKSDAKVISSGKKLKSQVQHELQLLSKKVNHIHDSKKLQQIYSVLKDL